MMNNTGHLFLRLSLIFATSLCLSIQAQPSNNMHPSVSSDGTKILFESDRDGNNEIYMMNIDGSSLKRLTDHPANDTAPVWSQDGSKVIFRSTRDTQRHPWPYYAMNLNGTNIERLESFNDVFRDRSPDGSKILYFGDDYERGNTDIYIMNVDGTNKKRLTSDKAFDSDTRFSPDGTRIVYESFVKTVSTAGIYVMALDGSNKRRLADGTDPQWSPDGTRILYKSRNTDGKCCDIYVMQADGTHQKKLAEMSYFHRWLPDGSKIVYFSSISGMYQIYIMNPDGMNKTQLTQ